MEPFGLALHQEVSLGLVTSSLRMQTVKRHVHKGGFLERLQMSLQLIVGFQHVFIRESCSDFSVGVVDVMLIGLRPLLQIEFFLYLYSELKLPVSAIKGYRSALNHVFTLANTDLMVN